MSVQPPRNFPRPSAGSQLCVISTTRSVRCCPSGPILLTGRTECTSNGRSSPGSPFRTLAPSRKKPSASVSDLLQRLEEVMDPLAVPARYCERLASVHAQIPAQLQIFEHVVDRKPRFRRFPAKALRRKVTNVLRVDTAAAKALDESWPISPNIFRHKVAIGGDQRPQIFAESQIDWRTVVQRSNADVQHMTGRLACFLRKPAYEIVRDLAFRSTPVPPVASRMRSALRRR